MTKIHRYRTLILQVSITSRESLRDIETCLNSHRQKLYHIGFRGQISRSTLSYANETRDYRIYQDFGHILIKIACKLYQDEDIGLDIKQVVYAFDSTTIDICLSTFPWARFRKTKAAVKMHTLLNLRGPIPTFVVITHGRTPDVIIMDDMPIEANSIYTLDRAYLDFRRPYHIHLTSAFFVIRAKDNLRFRRLYSNKADKTIGVQTDQAIMLVGHKSKTAYPEPLRRGRNFKYKFECKFRCFSLCC